jgi:hypothetical protein
MGLGGRVQFAGLLVDFTEAERVPFSCLFIIFLIG